MPNILRKIGDEFAWSDTSGTKALLTWLSILVSAGIFLLAGTLQSTSWMVVVSLLLIAILLIVDLWQLLIIDFGRFLHNKMSSRWDRVGKEEE